MEEDDPSDTAVDALVGCEEQLAVATPVLLCVLNPNGVQAFRHAACKQHTHTNIHTYIIHVYITAQLINQALTLLVFFIR